jgi:hypothetical protein
LRTRPSFLRKATFVLAAVANKCGHWKTGSKALKLALGSCFTGPMACVLADCYQA